MASLLVNESSHAWAIATKMEKAFCLAWPVFMLMELLVDIEVIFSDYHSSDGRNALAGVMRVTFRATLTITHVGNESISRTSYQLSFSQDLTEPLTESGKENPGQQFASLPWYFEDVAAEIIPTTTDSSWKVSFPAFSYCGEQQSTQPAYLCRQGFPTPTNNLGNVATGGIIPQLHYKSPNQDPVVNVCNYY